MIIESLVGRKGCALSEHHQDLVGAGAAQRYREMFRAASQHHCSVYISKFIAPVARYIE